MDRIKITSLRANPANPRTIKDESFYKLVNNILKYPKFLSLRPIVHLERVIQGGNMRHRAISYIVAKPAVEFCQLADKLELTREAIETWEEIRATKTIPTEWTKDASNLTDDELRAFIIIDNNDFGDWNTEALANDWDLHELLAWGTEIPGFKIEPEKEDEPDEKEKSDAWFVQVRCDNEAHAEQVLKACINEGLDAKIKN